MARLLWLPQVLRAAGLTVHEVDGWRTRGQDAINPRGLIAHDTGGSASSSDTGEINVLLNGSNTAPPPIAQLYLSRSGAYTVVASGLCYHALIGWGGPLEGVGNNGLIGIEAAANPGRPWPAAQYAAYVRGVAAICRHMGWDVHRNVAAHREHQPGDKGDPAGIDMARFRADVASTREDDMGDVLVAGEPLGSYLARVERALWWQIPGIAQVVARLEVAAAADEARDKATQAALTAIAAAIRAGGGSVDVVPVLARINEVAAAESRAVAELQGQVADLRARLAEAAQAEADKLTGR